MQDADILFLWACCNLAGGTFGEQRFALRGENLFILLVGTLLTILRILLNRLDEMALMWSLVSTGSSVFSQSQDRAFVNSCFLCKSSQVWRNLFGVNTVQIPMMKWHDWWYQCTEKIFLLRMNKISVSNVIIVYIRLFRIWRSRYKQKWCSHGSPMVL